MRTLQWLAIPIVLCPFALLGCGASDEAASDEDSAPNLTSFLVKAEEERKAAKARAEAEEQAKLPSPDEPPSEITLDDMVAGQNMRKSSGSLSRTMVQIPNTKIRAVLEIQIPYAMKLWNAEKGRNPKDHEEFMKAIVKANNLVLPELKPGYEYWYDAESAQLLKRPAQPEEESDSAAGGTES